MSTAWQVVVVLLAIAVVLQAIALVALMRQVGRVLLRMGRVRVGEIEGGGPDVGTKVEIEPYGIRSPGIVLFMSPGCGPCRDLHPSVRAFADAYDDIHVTVVMNATDPDGNFERELDGVATLTSPEVYSDWSVPGTPFAVGLADEGYVRIAGVVNTLEQLEVMRAAVFEPANRHEPEPPPATPVSHDSNGREHEKLHVH